VANEPRPQRPDTDPCARSKLEVLGDPTVEDKAPVEIRRINLAQRIAEPVVGLIVEGFGGKRGLAPVAGRDAGTFDPCLGLALDRHRQSSCTRATVRWIAGQRKGFRLGRSEPVDDRHPGLRRGDGELVERLPCMGAKPHRRRRGSEGD
jgi:hypothetical protein